MNRAVEAAILRDVEILCTAAKVQCVVSWREIINHQPVTCRFARESLGSGRITNPLEKTAGLHPSHVEEAGLFEVLARVGHGGTVDRGKRAGPIHRAYPA